MIGDIVVNTVNNNNNYFRIKGTSTCLFFDDTDYKSTEEAYKKLVEFDFVLFRPCAVEGPWNNTPLVGHRDRADILADLEASTNIEECVSRSLELSALDSRFEFSFEVI